MILWLNGPFGVGKTSTAQALRPLLAGYLWDPELVGTFLQAQLPAAVEDFQDWPAWRTLVVATGHALRAETQRTLVAPQTVLRQDYWAQISSGLRDAPLVHVLLDAPVEVLRRRILDDPDQGPRQWRLEHLPAYEAARPWMCEAADLVIDTTSHTAAQVAEQISAWWPSCASSAALRGGTR